MATWEKFMQKATDYMQSRTISIFGCYVGDRIAGIIVVDQEPNKTPEIMGIAVDSQHRKQGIGKRLILHACDSLNICTLTAETDDDAVSFYKRCGFEAEEFTKVFESGEYKRYKCVLNVKGNKI